MQTSCEGDGLNVCFLLCVSFSSSTTIWTRTAKQTTVCFVGFVPPVHDNQFLSTVSAHQLRSDDSGSPAQQRQVNRHNTQSVKKAEHHNAEEHSEEYSEYLRSGER